ncbi:MAG: T9SS type B sorting domain-containing protein [Chitinophagaceae bacterium]|nr:MAG: T9SS type B sorting domain-containing protein [Chitinophagaceae bacterium]
MHHPPGIIAILLFFGLFSNVCISQPCSFKPDFGYDISPCDPLTLNFTGSGTTGLNPVWNFGDGTIVTGTTSPTHSFASEGNYIVSYTLSNGICTDVLSVEISVRIVRENIVFTTDTTFCNGTVKQLRSDNMLNYCWSPSMYLNDPTIQNPTTSTPVDITYFLTGLVPGANLITNGNFSAGNTGFTSAYSYAANNVTEAQYYVSNDPVAWNRNLSACREHTGAGNMMLVNGSANLDAIVWSTVIPVTPNTNYAFSTWVQSLASLNPAQLRFSINGQNLGDQISAGAQECVWSEFYTAWNSGSNTTATIAIVNRNTIRDGNDFALDDISFAPFQIKRDSVRITVDRPPVTASNDTAVCRNSPVQLAVSGAQTYGWTPSAGLSNTNTANPVAITPQTVEYIVTGTSANGCTGKDTVLIEVLPSPVVTVTDDITICQNTSVQLGATGGVEYLWTPAGTLSDPGIASPVATPTGTTTYVVDVRDANQCLSRDSVTVSLRPLPVFSATPEYSVCYQDSVRLDATGGDVYTWSPATGVSNPSIASPRVSPGSTTLYTVEILETTCNLSASFPVEVNVRPLPVLQTAKSNDLDCSTGSSQLSVRGASTYLWSPATGLSDPTSSNPRATPRVTTTYAVTGSDRAGCASTDSLTIEFSKTLLSGYFMPTAFTPNRDGINDCYSVSYWGVIENIEFSIYNRWGERIFYSTSPNACWNGTYKGIPQEAGTYVYMIKANTVCESGIFRKGTFVLIR